jgi:hypothetical protein
MKTIILIISLLLIALIFTGCGNQVYEILSHETAFVIPLQGDGKDQTKFDSAKMVNKLKVAGKRIVIHSSFELSPFGNWPEGKLIKVNRRPVNRNWTESNSTGSSYQNQAFIAESNEADKGGAISFYARFSCTCNIQEKDAALYLYTYPSNLSLSKLMDTEIRTKIGGAFIRKCAPYSMDEIRVEKNKILTEVKGEVIPYFQKKGITIQALEYSEEFKFLDKSIQDSINEKIQASNERTAQKIRNEAAKEKALADKKIVETQSETLQKTIELQKIELQRDWIKKWDGKLPQTQTTGNSILQIPVGGG